ncbi:hypothetical protein ACLOJK_026377 [Asimina triloba]
MKSEPCKDVRILFVTPDGRDEPVETSEMASSSASSKSQGMLKRKCLCGLPTVILTSNTIRNPGRRFFRCMHYQDPARDCNFFRWLDEGHNSRSDCITANSGSDARSHIRKHEEIVSDFGELLHCVTALKEAHLAETADWKQKHKALKEENPTKEKSGQSEFGRERYDQNSAGCPEWTAFGIRSADGRSGVLNTIRIRIRSGFRILKTNLTGDGAQPHVGAPGGDA